MKQIMLLFAVFYSLSFQALAQNPFPLRDFRQSAETSQIAMSLNLATSMIEGRGVQKNIAEARVILTEIIEKKASAHPQSMEGRLVSIAYVTLAKTYLPQNEAHALKLLHHSAVYFGNPDAQYWLGKMAQDKNEGRQAVRWYAMAANKAHSLAMIELGRLLFEGKTVHRNAPLGLMHLMLTQDNEDKEQVLAQKFPDIFLKSTFEERERAKLMLEAKKSK